MVKLLSQSIPADANKTVFATMLDSMRVKQFRVRAVGAPFDAKDALKAAGYRWEDVPGKAKAWCTNAQESALEEVRGFLSGLGCSSPAVNPITLKDRFTNRV
jgi:DNA polymerase-3 subunit epsilon